jgi:hypothetical protein
MRHLGDGPFRKGEPIWVIEPDGSRLAAEYVGDREAGTWFGGPASAFVLFVESDTTGAVELDRILPRES